VSLADKGVNAEYIINCSGWPSDIWYALRGQIERAIREARQRVEERKGEAPWVIKEDPVDDHTPDSP
jgi:hypothetical protein